MEEYEKTDKTWWQATDFMYKHLLSTGQSWSHVQKLEFVKNLSEMFKRIERNASAAQPPPIDMDSGMFLGKPFSYWIELENLSRREHAGKFDKLGSGRWKFLVIYCNDGEEKTFETWVDTSKPFYAKINDRSVSLLDV